jgi:hypothetical protein
MEAWAETIISRELFQAVQKDVDLEDRIEHNLINVIRLNIPKNITMPYEWEEMVEITTEECDDGNMLYRAVIVF